MMNCDCIKTIEGKLKERVQSQIKGAVHSIECSNIAFVFGETSYTALSIPFAVKADEPRYRSQKGKALSVHASYCPFCGVSAKPEEKPLTPPA